jgi:Uma2 family endonuclease
MIVHAPLISLEQFDEFVLRPENADRNFEFIAGEIVEVVSNNYSSLLGIRIGGRISLYAEDHHLGHVTGADGGYIVVGERYIPDAAFTSYARQPEPCYEAYNPIAPDLAVEVLSPGNADPEIARKLGNYLAAGTHIWLVNPETKTVDVYVPGQPRHTLRVGDTLADEALLPGFTIALATIFKD